MNRQTQLLLVVEVIWWIATFVVLFMVMRPITGQIYGYTFRTGNIFLVITTITCGRYLFLLPHTLIAKLQWIKLILMFLCIPVLFYSIRQLSQFHTFADNLGIQSIVRHLPDSRQQGIIRYIRTEMIVFGVGSIVGSVGLAVRLLISIWRYRNRGTV